jgi:hypothetical protein
VVGGSIPTARAAAAEGVIGSWEEADKSSRTSSAGNQGFGVGKKVAMGISVKRGARIIRVGAVLLLLEVTTLSYCKSYVMYVS